MHNNDYLHPTATPTGIQNIFAIRDLFQKRDRGTKREEEKEVQVNAV